MTYKPPYIPNYAFQINSTLDRGSQNIRLLLLQAQAEGRDFSGMSLNLDNIYIEGGGLSEFKDQFGNTIKRSRDKFGRFTSNTGAAIKKGTDELYSKLFSQMLNGEIDQEEYEKRVIEILELSVPPTAADKVKKAIRAVPGQVEKGMNALLKSPEKAIASADAAYKSASKEVKSAIDATVSSGLDLLQKSKKDICNKIGATGKAAQDAFSSVVKAAQNKGKGVKERIESAKKKNSRNNGFRKRID
jgi:hypothetical protein